MVKVFSIVMSGLTLLGAVALGVKSTVTVRAPEAREWRMEPLEVQTSRHLAERVGVLRSEIARIASGDEAKAREIFGFAAAVQQIDRDDEELRREAGHRLNAAVVQSGSLWVEVKR